MHVIENDFLKVQVYETGAELKSVWDKRKSREYLWQRDAQYWAKSSPILFPIVGELKNGEYKYNGSTYSLPKHGFARDQSFRVIKHDALSISLLLQSGEETFEMYPFHFDFAISYTLQDVNIICQYEVVNKDVDPMYFSIGAHPAFNLEINNEHMRSDYFLLFPNDQAISRYFLENNLLAPHCATIALKENKLFLHDDMFNQDAWVLKGVQSTQVILQNRSGDYRISFNFRYFDYFGLWAPIGAPFICLEPWCGVNDVASHEGQLEQKGGIMKLPGMASWYRNWSIQIF
jgi:galactose mutarotase-like enzyme